MAVDICHVTMRSSWLALRIFCGFVSLWLIRFVWFVWFVCDFFFHDISPVVLAASFGACVFPSGVTACGEIYGMAGRAKRAYRSSESECNESSKAARNTTKSMTCARL